MPGFADLIVWREASALAAKVAKAMERLGGPSRGTIAEQMVRAAESIHSNIAEGYGKGISPDRLRFLGYSRTSCDELESWMRTSRLEKRLPEAILDDIIGHCCRVGYLLHQYEQWNRRMLDERSKKTGSKGVRE